MLEIHPHRGWSNRLLAPLLWTGMGSLLVRRGTAMRCERQDAGSPKLPCSADKVPGSRSRHERSRGMTNTDTGLSIQIDRHRIDMQIGMVCRCPVLGMLVAGRVHCSAVYNWQAKAGRPHPVGKQPSFKMQRSRMHNHYHPVRQRAPTASASCPTR